MQRIERVEVRHGKIGNNRVRRCVTQLFEKLLFCGDAPRLVLNARTSKLISNQVRIRRVVFDQ